MSRISEKAHGEERSKQKARKLLRLLLEAPPPFDGKPFRRKPPALAVGRLRPGIPAGIIDVRKAPFS